MNDVKDKLVSRHTSEGSAVNEPVAGLAGRLVRANDVSVSHDDRVLRGGQASD